MWQTFCDVAAAAAGNASLHDSNSNTTATATTTDWFQLFKKVKGVFKHLYIYYYYFLRNLI